ncbi:MULTISPECIES: phage major capsid protein [unclassified Rhizobium]|uniref:phage major capsid protein n=1 Tax=unclassified Rhizobium TaxID=2613769 RepID=UPI001ADB8501|nr:MULTISPECIES: phage major capsid protein [unclassified Rhizobium]MBO9097827.1 phage major capsid protein [Rhizobium sp. L58/93]MBO9133391.1 phage major capsid protein [Rhizobium sp. B209b/85]MBO9167978.1 phage major capsid protein [Rhizobium sp. L245/93]MBO9184023.1 phage major capsid protein [Rhizobium sp. E27B/91]QXZ84248.1 phage major capsid protein [Rhizobium sp. K1/93]
MSEQTATAPRGGAMEIKTVPETVGAAFEEFMEAFEAFKDVNDRRLGEIEGKLTSDVVTREKVDRINKAMDDHKKVLDQLVLKKARPPLGRSLSGSVDAAEHKAAFETYIRRGDASGLREIEAKALSVGSNGDGGYLVPDQTDTEIGRRLSVVSPIRALATVRQVSGSVLKKPFTTQGLASGWVSETAARPQTTAPQLAELTFPTMELYSMPAATQALLDDAAVDIESWISSEVDIVFAEQEGTAFVTGDGVAKPKGFLAYPSVADAGWSWGNLGYIATGAAGAFLTAGPTDVLIDAVYALKAGHRQNGNFVMNRRSQATIRKFKDADGNYLWRAPSAAGQSASLMGFPITEAEDMPDIAADAPAIAFGDFRAGYLVVDRTGIRVLRDPYSAKPYVLFYTTKRVGGGVQDFEAIKLIKFSVS